MTTILAPSILAGDFTNLMNDIKMLNKSDAYWIHFVNIDGVFVPNIPFGFLVLGAINHLKSKPLDLTLEPLQL